MPKVNLSSGETVMPSLSKCDRQSCLRDQFPNQLKPLESPEGVVYELCPDCHKEISAMLENKGFVGSMMRSEMTIKEYKGLMREKAEEYAMSDFNMGDGV